MKERPIIFSAPMVRAILEGRKSMTRRIVKPSVPIVGIGEPSLWNIGRADTRMPTWEEWGPQTGHALFYNDTKDVFAIKCPYGSPGDRLWVRENFWMPPFISELMLREGADTWPEYVYCADPDGYDEQWKEWGWKKKPSIHMPRWASRLTLEITGVRVERMQEISEEDAIKEGAEWRDLGRCGLGFPLSGWSMEHPQHHGYCLNTARMAFANFINKLHGGNNWNIKKQTSLWDANPWVWVIEFKRM